MTRARITVPGLLLEKVKRAVRSGPASNVSAYFTEAVDERVKLNDLAELLVQMLTQTGGPLRAAERRAADAALGVPRRA